MVETPKRQSSRTRQSSQAPDASDVEDSVETAAPREQITRRRTARFIENLDEDEDLKPVNGTANGYSNTNGHTNGHANGHTNGHANGYSNGHTNGNANGHTNGYSNGYANGSSGAVPNGKDAVHTNGTSADGQMVDGWKPGQDPKVDYSGEFEFGGSVGTGFMMLFFPILMWYMWVGATYYGGKFPYRTPGQSWAEFGTHLVDLVYTNAFPHSKAWLWYWSYLIFEGACYCLLPGVWGKGKPLPHAGGKQMDYFCNAYVSLYTTLVVLAGLHFSGIWPIYTALDEFGPLLSVAICSGFIVSIVAYFSALWRGKQHRMTGYPVYDFFMGAELNPRLFGILDFKMFFEVRMPWYFLLILSLGAAARQYEQYGYVSGEVMFLVMAHYLYANACAKGEELIITTW